DLLAPGDSAARQAAGEDLGEGGQVGLDAIGLLRPALCDPKPGHDLVKDQQHAVLGSQPPQGVQEIRVDRQFAAIGAGRLDNRGSDLALVLLQGEVAAAIIEPTGANGGKLTIDTDLDRKRTRLNSSHRTTSYAAFC